MYMGAQLYPKYPSGSICVDMSGMDKILAINGVNLSHTSRKFAHINS